MNKKGYTLVEVIVSVMIISIASTILAVSFVKVINFMSKSNNVKKSSDDMMTYFEGNLENETDSFTSDSIKKIEYSILNGSSEIVVSGNIEKLKSKIEDGIELKQINYKQYNILAYDNDFIDFIKFHDSIYQSIDSIKLVKENKVVCEKNWCEKEASYYEYVATLNPKDSLPFFDREYLPESMKTTDSSIKYYIRICYPWNILETGYADPLIYVTQSTESAPFDESVQLVFDYENSTWYYYQLKDAYFMEQGGNHILWKGVFNNDMKFNKVTEIKSWEELKKQMKTVNSGWKMLNEKAIVGDYSNYWINVK